MVDRSESIISHYDRPYMPSSYKKKKSKKSQKEKYVKTPSSLMFPYFQSYTPRLLPIVKRKEKES